MKDYSGVLKGDGLKFGIVVSRFNDTITRNLLNGAIDMLTRHGVADNDIEIFWVPGAFELPQVAKKVAQRVNDAVIVLGTVIRGATPHFDYVAGEAAKGIAQVALGADKPVIFGVLTVDDYDQAFERSGIKANKGADAALSAIEMANLLKSI